MYYTITLFLLVTLRSFKLISEMNVKKKKMKHIQQKEHFVVFGE